jgi:hypothetical protein
LRHRGTENVNSFFDRINRMLRIIANVRQEEE